jgi:hypothetical protein
MRHAFNLLAGAALVVTLGGCSDTESESGTKPFKAPTSPAIDQLRENMSNTAKTGTYSKKQVIPDAKAAAPAATPGKDAEKKP